MIATITNNLLRYIIGVLLVIVIVLVVNIICETNSELTTGSKYYACKYGTVCYLKNYQRANCNIEFDSLKTCQQYVQENNK